MFKKRIRTIIKEKNSKLKGKNSINEKRNLKIKNAITIL